MDLVVTLGKPENWLPILVCQPGPDKRSVISNQRI